MNAFYIHVIETNIKRKASSHLEHTTTSSIKMELSNPSKKTSRKQRVEKLLAPELHCYVPLLHRLEEHLPPRQSRRQRWPLRFSLFSFACFLFCFLQFAFILFFFLGGEFLDR